jgi:hypothetical protein
MAVIYLKKTEENPSTETATAQRVASEMLQQIVD